MISYRFPPHSPIREGLQPKYKAVYKKTTDFAFFPRPFSYHMLIQKSKKHLDKQWLVNHSGVLRPSIKPRIGFLFFLASKLFFLYHTQKNKGVSLLRAQCHARQTVILLPNVIFVARFRPSKPQQIRYVPQPGLSHRVTLIPHPPQNCQSGGSAAGPLRRNPASRDGPNIQPIRDDNC